MAGRFQAVLQNFVHDDAKGINASISIGIIGGVSLVKLPPCDGDLAKFRPQLV
jgi:hypothetical protein